MFANPGNLAFNSLALGDIADRFGRRPLILLCLFLMTIGMALAATAASIAILSSYRFLRVSVSAACWQQPTRFF